MSQGICYAACCTLCLICHNMISTHAQNPHETPLESVPNVACYDMLYVYVIYQHMLRTHTEHQWNQCQTRGPRCMLSVMRHVVSYVLYVICLGHISTHAQNSHETPLEPVPNEGSALHVICYASCCILQDIRYNMLHDR